MALQLLNEQKDMRNIDSKKIIERALKKGSDLEQAIVHGYVNEKDIKLLHEGYYEGEVCTYFI